MKDKETSIYDQVVLEAVEWGIPECVNRSTDDTRDAVDVVALARGKSRNSTLHSYRRTELKRKRRIEKLNEPIPTSTVDETDLLRKRVHELENTLAQHRASAITDEIIRAEAFELGAYNPSKPDWIRDWDRVSKVGSSSMPMIFLSDLHWGEVVDPEQVFHYNEYSSPIAAKRLAYTIEKTKILLRDHLSEHDFPGIVLVLGGDMVSGRLHGDLAESNDLQIIPSMFDCADHLVKAITELADEFGHVDIWGVPGNHGRLTNRPYMKFYAHTNCDYGIYLILEKFAFNNDPRITCHFPPARDVTFEVAGRKYRLSHGDQFKGGDSIIGAVGPVIRGDTKKRAAALTFPTDAQLYDTLIVGHWHWLFMDDLLIMNGTMKGFDELSVGWNFKFRPPQQALWTVHTRWGHTFHMPINCDPGFGIEIEEKG